MVVPQIYPAHQTIVLGGGLAGFSAAHTILEHGGRVLLLDKSPFCGGNSTKATSGINGSGTRAQKKIGIDDSAQIFTEDTMRGGAKKPDVVKVLCDESASAVEWLIDKFELDLSLVSRLGGHSQPRTHRGPERFPGMTITYALMQRYENLCEKNDSRARLVNKARATRLLTGDNKNVIGIEFVDKEGVTHMEYGPVIICTGGFGADFASGSLLSKYRPDLLHLPTSNGEHCTGDGIKMAEAIGARLIDMEWVQVHPTGLVHPEDADAKVKFLAAEALRGVGGVLIDRNGNRFCNELGRRDYVTGEMWKSQPPFRLILNEKASNEIHWHCEHYCGRGVMKKYPNAKDLASEMNINPSVLDATFKAHNEIADKAAKDPEGGPYPAYPTGKSYDPFGKKFFHNTPTTMGEQLHVAIVTPIIHYCMGGLEITPAGECLSANSVVLPGLYCAGEAAGGVHGNNRLGGNSLLDCVVFGRVCGRACSKYMFDRDGKFRLFPKEEGVFTPGCS